MAVLFGAQRGDSSDDDDVPDLSTWKSSTLPKATGGNPAPVAQTTANTTSRTYNARNINPESETMRRELQLSPKRQSSSILGFQAINTPARHGASKVLATPEVAMSDVRNADKQDIDGDTTIEIVIENIDRSEYEDLSGGGSSVRSILRAITGEDGDTMYEVAFGNYLVDQLTLEQLEEYTNGRQTLQKFEQEQASKKAAKKVVRRSTSKIDTRHSTMSSSRPGARTQQRPGFVNTIDNISISGSDEEQASTRRSSRRRRQDTEEDGNEADFGLGDSPESEDEHVNMAEDDSDDKAPRRRSSCAVKTKTDTRRRSGRKAPASEDDEDEDDLPLKSDIYKGTKRKREPHGMRHSERSTRHTGGMQEIEVDNIYRSSSDETAAPVRPKTTSTREVFQALPRSDDFRMRHNQFCDTCGQGQNAAPLIYCQGCSLSYHKSCLGHRTGREHLVTKISEDNFVLQCRRCVAFPKKKDPVAPDHAKCQDCREPGLSCRPFRRRTTPAQEQKARDENDGVDPATHVDSSRINNADNVLFRCTACFRGFHYEHLPSRSDMLELEMAVDAEQRFREYSRDWKCRDCVEQPAKVSGIIAWKPMDEDAYDPNNGLEAVEEDNKIYLVKWEGMSYFRARWMAGAWVWGVTASGMRKAFAKREDSQHPKMRTEDAIPEDYLRADIVLDIKFTSIVDINTEEVDKARIREVDKTLVKYKGLGYEDAVWEAPPAPEDGDRWTDFVTAYNDWVARRYVKPPKCPALRTRIERARKEDFQKLEKKAQPANLVGGELMKYQIEGLNWLYYKWQQRKNAILADEMGLGKTIQIIGLLATLVQDWTCYPFLVVVPNSTCPNWRREIKRWAPSLRVVAYYGSQQSRDLAHRYELYPEGSRVLRCHIVVTSYDAAADENCRKFFRGVPWQGLIVDEGQRLKNDKNQLYLALEAMKIPFKVLMTGTPLQNNQRELFNLLHFLDETFNAAELEAEYEELDPQKLARLHELIRPFFLRRTKAQVLTFLPPMAQIIVPVSMSIVQKTLYKNILAKNPDLLRSIFSQEATAKDVKTAERASLNNILMQLRKCLCHPFVYSNSIEDRNVSVGASHRNLVDASGKLKLLELLLPRLQQLGHRVLIFSQFLSMLDMVEDFLEGLTMRYMRLDGQISSLQKQKRIDAFNAPDSPYFAFLLSTRAGGVGINLATADTVIILDPDFNPHQDIQALARAHRIGQTKKVLCFQLVTRASAEERIMQIGRKKLALEHLLIRSMDTEEEADENELSSVLRHGVAELFEDNGEQDIVFDAFSIDRLLDRSHIEAPPQGEGQSVENQFSFAKVWANDKAALQDAEQDLVEEAPDPGMWVNILKERERIAAEEAAAKAVTFGRGRRARQNVDYAGNVQPEVDLDEAISTNKRGRRRGENDESDTDFQDDDSDGDDDVAIVPGEDAVGTGEISELTVQSNPKPSTGLSKPAAPEFRRVIPVNVEPVTTGVADAELNDSIKCRACQTFHQVGSCPLKIAGVEHCGLCGIAHFGHARVCPHIQSETQVRAMLEALKYSTEPEHLIKEAKRYLTGVKGHLVQMKKQAETKRLEQEAQQAAMAYTDPNAPSWQYQGNVYMGGGGGIGGGGGGGYQVGNSSLGMHHPPPGGAGQYQGHAAQFPRV